MKNNKNCKIIISGLITVLAFVTLIVTMMETGEYGIFTGIPSDPIDWHLGGFYLTLILLGFIFWITKTLTYTVSMVKNHEENYIPKLVFEILVGLGFAFALVAFFVCYAEDVLHGMHAAQNLAYIGTPMAFVASLVSNALTLKK